MRTADVKRWQYRTRTWAPQVDGDEQARTARVVADVCDPGGRRDDGRARRRRKVDAGVHVAAGTERIERLELERRAAERLGDHRAGARPRRAEVVSGRPAGTRRTARRPPPPTRSEPSAARPSCRRAAPRARPGLTPWWSSDSSLWATFSALPIAPGTLKTTSRAARAKRWRSGLKPLFSSANPIAMTNSCTGCMNRFVTKSFRHSLARWAVSGSTSSRPASGAEIASTISTV